MDENLYTALEERFVRNRNGVAFSTGEGRVLATFGDLLESAARYANALEASGIRPGDRVTVQGEKCLAMVFLYLAALKAGAVLQPLNPAYTVSEVDFFLSDAEPALFLASPARSTEMARLAADRGIPFATIDSDQDSSLARLAARQPVLHRTIARSKDDLAGLLYTSGTTGKAKGAMISHGNLLSNAHTLQALWAFTQGDVLLHALPLFHVHGLYVALNTAFLNCSRILWLERFEVRAAMRLLGQSSVFMGVPTYYTRLLGESDFAGETCRQMRLFISGSAPLLPETHKQFRIRTGHDILERYGMTETGMIASNPYRGARVAGTVGFALPDVEVRIAAPGGGSADAGVLGMIEVRGPNVFKGYWRRAGLPDDDFTADGFFRTGDVGTMDGEGRISIVGRSRDLIITGGLNVYPREIELAIDALPEIVESAVVGVPHPDYGEGIVAAVVSRAGEEGSIIAALRNTLAAYKIPKRVFFLSELPRNSMGKIQKEELRRRFAGAFAS